MYIFIHQLNAYSPGLFFFPSKVKHYLACPECKSIRIRHLVHFLCCPVHLSFLFWNFSLARLLQSLLNEPLFQNKDLQIISTI